MFASLAYAYPLYNGHSLLELQYNLYQLDRSSCRIDPKSPKSFLLTTLDNSTTSDAVTAILWRATKATSRKKLNFDIFSESRIWLCN